MSLELLLAPVTEYNTVSKPHSLKDPRFIQEQFYSPNEDATLVKPKKYNPVARVINRLPVYQSVFKPKRTTDTNAFRTAFREQFALKQETLTFIGWSEIDKFRWLINATTRQLESVRPENYFGVRVCTHKDAYAIIDFDNRMANKAQLRDDGFYLINASEPPLPFDDPRFIEIFKSVKNIWLDRKTYKPISRSYIIRESPETQQLANLSNEISTARNNVDQLIRDQILHRYIGFDEGIKPDSESFINKVQGAIDSIDVKECKFKDRLVDSALLLNNQAGGGTNARKTLMTWFFIACITPKFNNSLGRNPSLLDDIKREYILTYIQVADFLFGKRLEGNIDNMSVYEYNNAIDISYSIVKPRITRERGIPGSDGLKKSKNSKIVYPSLFTSSYNKIKVLMIKDFAQVRNIKLPEDSELLKQLEQPELLKQLDQPKQLDQTAQTEQPEQPEQPDQTAQTEQPEQPEQPEQTEQPKNIPQ